MPRARKCTVAIVVFLVVPNRVRRQPKWLSIGNQTSVHARRTKFAHAMFAEGWRRRQTTSVPLPMLFGPSLGGLSMLTALKWGNSGGFYCLVPPVAQKEGSFPGGSGFVVPSGSQSIDPESYQSAILTIS